MAAKFYIGGIYQQRGKPFRLLSVHVGERELLYSCRAQRPNSDAADRGAWTYAPYVETPEDRLFTEAELAEAAFADERCVRCRNFFASQLLDRELRADPEFYIHPTLLGRYMNIWVGRCDLRCLTSRLGTLNPFCAYYTDRDPSKPADAASLRAALSRFELCCESDGSGAVRRLRGGSNAVSLLELPALFPERETLASLLPSAACDVYVFHHSAAGVLYSGGEDANGFLSEAVVCSMPLDRASLAELYALWMNMDADSLVTADGSPLLLRGEEGLYIVS